MELIIRNAVYRLVFWRVLGDLFTFIRGVLLSLHNYSCSVEKAVWLLEIEAARTYHSLTGIDPGQVVGDDSRFHLALGSDIEFRIEDD